MEPWADPIVQAIHQLMTPADPKKKRPIGFAPWKEKMMLTHTTLAF